MAKEQEPGSRGNSTLLWILGCTLLLPILYVLSTGPVAGLVTRSGMNPAPLRVLYLPVIWLHDNTNLREPLEQWVKLWAGK